MWSFLKKDLGSMKFGLSDAELADYGVFDAIAKLGLTFSKLDIQRQIIAEKLHKQNESSVIATQLNQASTAETTTVQPATTLKLGKWTISRH
jgi:hypothetical protein